MKKDIYFVTGNKAKFEEVKYYLKLFNPEIELKQLEADIPEIQTLDQKTIAIDKALKAWKIFNKPLIVDDTAVYFEKYNKFPGTMAKYVYQGIGFDGLTKLITSEDKASFVSYLVYIYAPDSFKLFEGKTEGTLLKPNDFEGNTHFPYDCLFKPNGINKTFLQLKNTEEGIEYLPRVKALKMLAEWKKNN